MLAPSSFLRHLASLRRLTSADGTLANLVFEHGVIGRTSTSEFIARHDMANIDQNKSDTENAEDN